ncbi:MAG: hypothetical protein JWL87_708 [Candidatus Adlerbacteria bacterium]|nr:hypothetical protein [Candidatus Adlerbacteria bacterium]
MSQKALRNGLLASLVIWMLIFWLGDMAYQGLVHNEPEQMQEEIK